MLLEASEKYEKPFKSHCALPLEMSMENVFFFVFGNQSILKAVDV